MLVYSVNRWMALGKAVHHYEKMTVHKEQIQDKDTVKITKETENLLRSALAYMSPDNRDLSTVIGRALYELGGIGFEMWDEWSLNSLSYSAHAQQECWPGFSGDGTSYIVVFIHAHQRGWKIPYGGHHAFKK
jgi:hypothetical protein